MEIRYSSNQRDFKRYTTEETRKEFLIENLYAANEVVAVYSHVDRMVTLGCMPTTETVPIDKDPDLTSGTTWHAAPGAAGRSASQHRRRGSITARIYAKRPSWATPDCPHHAGTGRRAVRQRHARSPRGVLAGRPGNNAA